MSDELETVWLAQHLAEKKRTHPLRVFKHLLHALDYARGYLNFHVSEPSDLISHEDCSEKWIVKYNGNLGIEMPLSKKHSDLCVNTRELRGCVVEMIPIGSKGEWS